MSVSRARLLLLLLGVAVFTLALAIEPRSALQQAERKGGLLPMLFGDGRRLFANHFFAKADNYFHRGVYPSIFDQPREEEMHMVSAAQSEEPDHEETHGEPEVEEEHQEHDAETCEDPTHQHATVQQFTGDWVAWLNHQVRPRGHAHLGGGEEREMLPWLALAAELDPDNVQNFTLTAYWLRTALGKVDEAEQFLRNGLKHNPGDPRILYELGLLLLDNRQDSDRAYHVLQYAWDRWVVLEEPKPDPDRLLGEGIVVRLARVDEAQGRLPQALEWLRKLEPLSPHPEVIAQEILEVEQRIAASAQE